MRLSKVDIGADTYLTRRVSVKGHWRQFIWEKKINGKLKLKTHVKWSKAWKSEAVKKLAIYRSSLTLGYPTSARNGSCEYRIWIYTSTPDVTTSELTSAMNKMKDKYGTAVMFDDYDEELNEPVSMHEKEPAGCDNGLWKGRAVFNREGVEKRYEADLGYR